MESTLPVGSLILLRGQGFPTEVPDDEGDAYLASEETQPLRRARLEPVLETRILNRIHNYWGFRVVSTNDGQASTTTGRAEQPQPALLELEQQAQRIGLSRFERQVFKDPEPDEFCTHMMQELLDHDVLV